MLSSIVVGQKGVSDGPAIVAIYRPLGTRMPEQVHTETPSCFLFLLFTLCIFSRSSLCLSVSSFLLWGLRVNSSDCPPRPKSRFESPLKFGPWHAPLGQYQSQRLDTKCADKRACLERETPKKFQKVRFWGPVWEKWEELVGLSWLLSMPNLSSRLPKLEASFNY